MTEELLAQIVEEVSVLTAQKARPEPRQVRRPARIEAEIKAAREAAEKQARLDALRQDTPTVKADGSIVAVGHRQMLALMRSRGTVKPGGGEQS